MQTIHSLRTLRKGGLFFSTSLCSGGFWVRDPKFENENGFPIFLALAYFRFDDLVPHCSSSCILFCALLADGACNNFFRTSKYKAYSNWLKTVRNIAKGKF